MKVPSAAAARCRDARMRTAPPSAWSTYTTALAAAAILGAHPSLPASATTLGGPVQYVDATPAVVAPIYSEIIGIDEPPPPSVFPGEMPVALTITGRTTQNALLRDGASAFVASALATAMLHPLDTVKCRLQSSAYTVEALCPGEGCVLGVPVPPGLVDLFRPRLRRRRPVAGSPRQRLYADVFTGLGAGVLKEAPDAAVYLAFYESLSRSLLVQPWWASHVVFALLIAGALGDAAGSVLRLPAEVLAKRLQTGTVATKQDGPGSLFADTPLDEWLDSWGAILSRDMPFGGLQVAFFEESREFFHAVSDATPDALTDVAAGVIAGALAAALTTPLDVVVTHTLTTSGEADSRGRSALSRARDLVQEQGPATLLRGIGLRTMYYGPQVGLFFGFYEFFRTLPEWGS